MKKLFVTILCFCSTYTFAQNGFFLQPEMGIGIASIKIKYPASIYTYPWGLAWQSPVKSIFTYDPQALIGYRLDRWSFTTGISMLRTGFTEDNVAAGGPGFIGFYYKETQYYNHAIVPVQVSYSFKLCDHFFFDPGIGGAVSYNYSSIIKMKGDYGYAENGKEKITVTGDEFNNNYNRTSFFGLVFANFGYQLNNRLDIIAGPEAQYMLTSLLKDKNNDQKNFAYTFNIGVKWYFRKNIKPIAPVASGVSNGSRN